MFRYARLKESGIYSKEQLIQERKRDLLHEYKRDREKPLQEATSANAQKLLELEQLGLLQTYKNYEQSLKWLRDLNINGYNFQIDQPRVNWKEIFDGAWLKEQILTILKELNLWLAMVRLRKNGNNLRNDKHDTIYHKLNYKILQRFGNT